MSKSNGKSGENYMKAIEMGKKKKALREEVEKMAALKVCIYEGLVDVLGKKRHRAIRMLNSDETILLLAATGKEVIEVCHCSCALRAWNRMVNSDADEHEVDAVLEAIMCKWGHLMGDLPDGCYEFKPFGCNIGDIR